MGVFTYNYVQLWTDLQSQTKLLPPGLLSNLGHRDALQSWRHRDEDAFKTPTQGTGPVFTPTHRTAGKGGQFPKAGSAWSQQGGMG